MQFERSGRRAPKGLRTSDEISIDLSKLKRLGSFAFASPSEFVLTFEDEKGTKKETVVLVLQRAVSYSEKVPRADVLSKYVPAPLENEEVDPETPAAK